MYLLGDSNAKTPWLHLLAKPHLTYISGMLDGGAQRSPQKTLSPECSVWKLLPLAPGVLSGNVLLF